MLSHLSGSWQFWKAVVLETDASPTHPEFQIELFLTPLSVHMTVLAGKVSQTDVMFLLLRWER